MAEASFTSPTSDTVTLPAAAFDSMVSTLFCMPILPAVLKCAAMVPVLPGITGSLVHSGVVQPQLTPMLEMTRGAVPVFLNLKVWSTTPPWATEPKSYFDSSKVMAGPATFAVAMAGLTAWACAV